jgi:hypothetical protein
MSDGELTISFEGSLPADAAAFAQNLEAELRETDSSVTVSITKERPDTQDFGSTLVLLFGTSTALALAKAVTAFLHRNSGASITITKAGTVVAKNLDSRDAAKIAEVFAGHVR